MIGFEQIGSEKIPTITKDEVVNLTLATFSQNKQVLIFNNSKRSSEATAQKVADALDKATLSNLTELAALAKDIRTALSVPTKQCLKLCTLVEKGVAFHHSGLTAKQRMLVERGFREGFIKVISSTPTLAAGLNLPAYKVIIKDYKRYSQRGFTDIPVLEYHQMSGRAGRPGKEDSGRAVVLAKSESEIEKLVTKYIHGKPEEILSKLAVEPTLKMYMLSLLAMDFINTEEEIKYFFSKTLYAHQYKDLQGLHRQLKKILDILKHYDFVEQEDHYFVATPLGKKVSELYLNPDTAHYFLEHLESFFKLNDQNLSRITLYSLVYLMSSSLEMRPLFSLSKLEEETYVGRAEELGGKLLVPYDPFEMDYGTFLQILKISDILVDWISEAHEDYLCEKYKLTPGELHYKIEIVDWLLFCLEELCTLRKQFFFKTVINKLRIRFKHGIREDLLPLIALKGVGRVRARQLHRAGFQSVNDLRLASFESISRVVGDSLSIKIKEQVKEHSSIAHQGLEIVEKPQSLVKRTLSGGQSVEASDDEIRMVLDADLEFEREKEERNRSLSEFF